MKKDKKWLSEEINELIDGYTSFGGHQHVYISKPNIDKLYDLIDQLDEPRKVIVPHFVADWWDGDSVTMYGGERISKKYKLRLISNFHDRGLGDYLSKVEDWLDENDSVFLDLVNGKPYEVQKEKLYVVELINNHLTHCLAYDLMCKVFFVSPNQEEKLNKYKMKFTEKEIKDYDPRYWAFAVEVEE